LEQDMYVEGVLTKAKACRLPFNCVQITLIVFRLEYLRPALFD